MPCWLYRRQELRLCSVCVQSSSTMQGIYATLLDLWGTQAARPATDMA